MKGDLMFLIMGAGSVGSFYGGLLASIGQKVVLIGREQHVDAINKNNLRIKGLIDKTVELSAITSPDELKSVIRNPKKNIKYIIVTTKAHQTKDAIIQLKDYIAEKTIFVSLQNGIGLEETIKAVYPNNRIIRAITSIGVCKDVPGIINYTGVGQTLVGYKNPKELEIARELVTILNETVISAKIESNINGAVYTKTIVNCGLNPLVAINQVKNIEIIDNQELKELAAAIAQEAWQVAKELNIDLTVENPIAYMFDVIKKTGDNYNSMMIDIREKRKTEIDFINGKIVELGVQMGLEMPINKKIVETIHEITKDFT
jgi:2-dehydropantoate 2-reductase